MSAGPFLAACALLVLAGATKIAQPRAAQTAARAAGLPGATALVVAFGLVEVASGGAGIAFGREAAVAVALVYAALAVVALRLLRRAPTTPCACLGSTAAPVTRLHVAIDVVAAVVALAAARSGSPLAPVHAHWFAGVVFVVMTACCVRLAMLVLEARPQLVAASEEGAR